MYDFLIIGGGCSGLSAAMYGTRLGLKTLTIAEMPGGLITTTHLVENWPGIVTTSGPDLANALLAHSQAVGAEMKNARVTAIENLSTEGCTKFKVSTASEVYEAKTILIATGTKHKKLGVPGEKELENKGVSYCALCDGAFFKDKVVCIVGGGDTAAKESLFLAEHAYKVYIIVRKDVLRAEPINAKRVEQNPKIEVVYKTEIAEIMGEGKVEKVKFKEGTGSTWAGKEVEMSGVFMAIGHDAQTELAASLGVALNEKKEIIINRKTETNIKGVYAAGDCCDTEFKQAITGSAEAVTSSYFAYNHVTTQQCTP